MTRAGRIVALVAAFLLATVVVTVAPEAAYACSCRGTNLDRAIRDADVIFRGTVTSAHDAGRGEAARSDIRFAVAAVYKGSAYADQVVASARDQAACGLVPAVGSSWVIFAEDGAVGSGADAVDRLVTGLCSGNLPTTVAPAVLGRGHQPLDGPSDREEHSLHTDLVLTRVLAGAGIALLFVGAIGVLGLVALWRPGRRVDRP